MISEKEIDHIASLARLELAGNEKEKFQKELSLILDYAAKLKELDVENVEPTSGGAEVATAMRQDQHSNTYGPETAAKILEQTPEKKGGFVKVRRVI